jgi:hypothetical protein
MLTILLVLACKHGDSADTDVVDTDVTAVPTYCEAAGRTERAWDPSGAAGDYDAVAPDLDLELLDGGELSLSDAWTGCDDWLFVNWWEASNYPNLDNAVEVRDWLGDAPQTTHLVFLSYQTDPDVIATELGNLRATMDGAIASLPDDDAAYWADHVHYASTSSWETGWIGDLDTAYYTADVNVVWSFGIDRFQRIRELGYLGDPATGWASAPPSFLDAEVARFDAESDRADRQTADAATVVRAFDATPQADGWDTEVNFPDVATMAGFDTMELDLTADCGGHPEAVVCPEWDYLTYVRLCPVGSDDCTEVGRFITTYARSGRWTVDATPFLALLRNGGPMRVKYEGSNAYLLTLDFRLSNQGKGVRPLGIAPLWTGGAFDADYNVGRDPIAFTPPEGTVRVDVLGLITGHGYGQDRENCAEFCNHQHEFTVNGEGPWLKEEPEAGNSYGCQDQVGVGTVPNQYGTWVYGRGGWCPGKQVDPWSADVTSAVDVGAENTIAYRGLFDGEPYVPVPHDSGQGFGANIDAQTWIVYYEGE